MQDRTDKLLDMFNDLNFAVFLIVCTCGIIIPIYFIVKGFRWLHKKKESVT